MSYRSIRNAEVAEKKVIVRTDFNIPFDDQGNILDVKRIRDSLPTIKYLIDNKAIVILISHNDRPEGKVVESLRMGKIAEKLGELLGKNVHYLDDCIGYDVEDFIDEMIPGEVVVLENIRFYAGEEENDAGFAKNLADLGDLYVNDAFAVSHRKHASVIGIPAIIPGYGGFLLDKEIEMLGKVSENPERPFVLILGGAKVKDKIEVIDNLLPKVDKLLIGGAIAFTFLKAQGLEVGESLVEDEKLELAKRLLQNEKIILPIDVVVAEGKEDSPSKVVNVAEIPKNAAGLDIGPDTLKYFETILQHAKTVVWNGPLGKYKWKQFAQGTKDLVKFLTELDAVVVVGGGDSAAVVEMMEGEDKLTHVSTGGGASLDFLKGKELPGIKAIENSKNT